MNQIDPKMPFNKYQRINNNAYQFHNFDPLIYYGQNMTQKYFVEQM